MSYTQKCLKNQELFNMTNILKIRNLKTELSKSSSKEEVDKLVDSIRHRWTAMKQRCYNVKCSSYKHYGGRGITVCDEWLNDSFVFIQWSLDNGVAEGLFLDRKNNDGNYTPDNCRYITIAESNRNMRRPTVPIEFVYDVLYGKYKDLGGRKIEKLSGYGSTTVSSIRHRNYDEEILKFKKIII